MKLVDAEITKDGEDVPNVAASAPRPARRRVYTSLLVTLTVLFGTVGVIYSIFPNRDNEALTTVIEAHLNSESEPLALEHPSGLEIRAWSLGIFGEPVPWPEVSATLVPQSASLIKLFKRDMAIVRYEMDGQKVSVAFWRAHDAPPRIHRRTEDGLYAVSWRRKRFTTFAIGPAASNDLWTTRLEAP